MLDQVLDATCSRIDAIASRYSSALSEVDGRVRRAMILADGIQKLRSALDDGVMQRFMSLQGSNLGFRTDKDKEGGYSTEIVRECLIDAMLVGVYPVGNEFNIIAGRTYVTQAGYKRLVREIPGMTNLEEYPGTPLAHNGQTVVRYGAKWKYKGMQQQLLDGEGKPGRVFAIRVNQGMGTDAIIGKAQRKALKAIYDMIHGSEKSAPDGEVDDGSTPANGAPETKESAFPTGRLSSSNGVHKPTETPPAATSETEEKPVAPAAETVAAEPKQESTPPQQRTHGLLLAKLDAAKNRDDVQNARDAATFELQANKAVSQEWYDTFLESCTKKDREFKAAARSKPKQAELVGAGADNNAYANGQ